MQLKHWSPNVSCLISCGWGIDSTFFLLLSIGYLFSTLGSSGTEGGGIHHWTSECMYSLTCREGGLFDTP